MVFSSFVEYKHDSKMISGNVIMAENGWEDWSRVSVTPYERKNGEWVRSSISSPGFSECKVQRREWCGQKEYRICLWEKWYPVTLSPVKGFKYAFFGPNDRAYCFDM